jgi:hypothetical protein
VTDPDFAVVRLYRDGTLYQVPLRELYARDGLRRIPLRDGDPVYVDADFDLEQAAAYFEEQIRLAEFRQRARTQALQELHLEIGVCQSQLNEARSNFRDQLEFGVVEPDYAYVAGEVNQDSGFALPFENRANLADALTGAGGAPTITADVSQVYVIRGAINPAEFAEITAWGARLLQVRGADPRHPLRASAVRRDLRCSAADHPLEPRREADHAGARPESASTPATR